MVVSWPCLVVEQLYLEDLEVKVIPVERSPPSLSSSWLSWAGTAVNLGPRLLRLNKNVCEELSWDYNQSYGSIFPLGEK